MGFGTLFFGYFLLLNITFFSYSDIIAAFLMMYAFYKLSGINKGFKYSFYASFAFAVFGFVELAVTVIELFLPSLDIGTLTSVSTMVRSLIICVLTVFMLTGIRDVCLEVGIKRIADRCKKAIYVTFILYTLNIIWQTDILGAFNLKAVVIIGYLVMVSIIFLVIVNLLSIHTCFVEICMPDEQTPKGRAEKKSRFGFVNAFRRHEEEKRREYFEYKVEKMKARAEKQKEKSSGKKR